MTILEAKNTPFIVLVKPQMGENVGAAARAMLNFGLNQLRIVNPRDGWPNPKAEEMSAGALQKMPPALVFDTLAEAVADLHYVYATTARPREMIKPVYTPHGAAGKISERLDQGQRIGIVFGGERAGLTNEDVALCGSIMTVPVNPDFSSLNLGQAVMLVAYELFQHSQEPENLKGETPATQDKLEEFLQRLEQDLEDRAFFRSEGLKPTMKRNIRAMFTRTGLSTQEVQTLQGILTALKR